VPQSVPVDVGISAKCWSEWQDLNLRPPRPERGALPAGIGASEAAFDKRQTWRYAANHQFDKRQAVIDPVLKAAAVALIERGEMRVAEVAELIGESRQLIATWCPSARKARREWCRQRWKAGVKEAGAAISSEMSKANIKKLADVLRANHQNGAKEAILQLRANKRQRPRPQSGNTWTKKPKPGRSRP
jgi:transposase-like protein